MGHTDLPGEAGQECYRYTCDCGKEANLDDDMKIFMRIAAHKERNKIIKMIQEMDGKNISHDEMEKRLDKRKHPDKNDNE